MNSSREVEAGEYRQHKKHQQEGGQSAKTGQVDCRTFLQRLFRCELNSVARSAPAGVLILSARWFLNGGDIRVGLAVEFLPDFGRPS